MSTIVIVGAGPRGAGLLERLAASAPELHPDGLDVHLVDPYPPGAGRIWRHAQSPLLAMNSMAADVTMYTDESVVCDGPDRARPVVLGVGAGARTAIPTRSAPSWPPSWRAVTAATFPSRRLQSAYLGWVLRTCSPGCPRACGCTCTAPAPPGSPRTATAPQVVHLDDGPPLRADAVVLASGHLDATPTADELALAARAAAAGLRYLPPEQTTDTDLSVLAPGETVLVRGLGLAFIDLVVLLFEGRGGRFEPDGGTACATCRPAPSRGWSSGSPRGAPYHAKTHYELRAGPPAAAALLRPGAGRPADRARAEPVDLRDAGVAADGQGDRLGLVPRAVRRPPRAGPAAVGRVRRPRSPRSTGARPRWTRSSPRPCPTRWTGIDFAALDRPLDGVRADRWTRCSRWCAARIAEDLRQHVDERHTPHLGAFVAMLSVYGEVDPAGRPGVLSAPLPGRRPALVAGLLQRGGQRPARLPGARAAGAVPGRATSTSSAPACGSRSPTALPGRQRHAGRRAAGDGRRARRRPAARPERRPHRATRCSPACCADGAVSEEVLRRRRRRRAAQHRPDPRAARPTAR